MEGGRGTDEAGTEERRQLRRAHERLRAASKELEALVATEPIKGRWAPEPAPAEILEAARAELHVAFDAVLRLHEEILGWPRP